VLDFDCTKIPADFSKAKLETARALGEASTLKAIAARAQVLRDAHLLDMNDLNRPLSAALPLSLRFSLAASITRELEPLMRDTYGRSKVEGSVQAIFDHQKHQFSRQIGSLSRQERAIWKAALYWESQGLHDRFSANEIHLMILWAGEASQYACKPGFLSVREVWSAYLAALDEQLSDVVRGTYGQFLDRQASYFRNTADSASLKRLVPFDPDGVIAQFRAS
jgi:hypothetical protein